MRDWQAFVRFHLRLDGLKPESEARIVRETAEQLEDVYQDGLRRGLSPDEADAEARGQIDDWDRFASQLQLSMPVAMEPCSVHLAGMADKMAGRGGIWRALGDLVRDALQSVRSWRRRPGHSLVSVFTLAVGIGSATAIFSLVHGVVLKALPYPSPDRLVLVWHTAPGADIDRLMSSLGTYFFYQTRNRTLEQTAVYVHTHDSLTGAGSPILIESAGVGPSFFDLFLAGSPSAGRLFVPEDNDPGADPVVLISHRLWLTRFGGDPGAVGKTIRRSGRDNRIVGVLPTGFDFPSPEVDLWWPLEIDPARSRLGGFNCTLVGRLKPGVSATDAQRDLQSLIPRLSERYPGPAFDMIVTRGQLTAQVTPLKEDLVGGSERILWLLLGSVGLVLLVAYSNVANLQLVRIEGRWREMAVRSAFGATRGRLARHLLAETLTLGLVGGAMGLLLAAAGVKALVLLGPSNIPRIGEVGITAPVFLFCCMLSLAAAVLFGLVPMAGFRPSKLNDRLQDESRGCTAGRPRARVRNFLVVSEVALALILLVASGLLTQSLWRLWRVDPGFDPGSILVLRLTPPSADYPDEGTTIRFHQAVAERIASIPGVQAVGATTCLPLRDCGDINPLYEEGATSEPGRTPPAVQIRRILPGYFRTMGIALLSGRAIERADIDNRTGAALVNRTLAERFWPGRNPIGKRVYPDLPHAQTGWYTIVGVVADVQTKTLSESPIETVYLPAIGPDGGYARSLQFVLKTAVAPLDLAATVQAEVWRLDSNLPIADMLAMTEIVSAASAPTSFAMALFAIAAAVAVSLAIVGVYGVLSYVVTLRRGEIGIRMVLGANGREILRLVLAQGAGVVSLGVAAGLVGALGLTRFMGKLLFHVDPIDPTTFCLMAAGLFGVALTACYIPARRAAAVDPNEALRSL